MENEQKCREEKIQEVEGEWREEKRRGGKKLREKDKKGKDRIENKEQNRTEK